MRMYSNNTKKIKLSTTKLIIRDCATFKYNIHHFVKS